MRPLRNLLIALAAVWAAPAFADEAVQVTVAPDKGDVLLVYELPAETRRVRFTTPAGRSRGGWSVETPGLSLSGEDVVGETPFRAFTLRLSIAGQAQDRAYSALTPVGEGFLIYGPNLLVAGSETRVRLAVPQGQISLPAKGPERGYAFVGPPSYVTRVDGLALVRAPQTPAWLAETVASNSRAGLDFYRARLGIDLPEEPIFALNHFPGGVSGSLAEVSGAYVVRYRLFGDLWASPDPLAARRLAQTALHESFHFWNGGMFRPLDGNFSPWLHEGAANYAALVAAVTLGVIDEAAAREALTDHLDGCRSVLDAEPLARSDLMRGSGVYDCGTVLQWLADLDARARGEDVFAVWRRTLAARPNGEAAYGVADFRRAAADYPLVKLLLDDRAAQRWPRLEAALLSRGVELARRRSPEILRSAAVGHLEQLSCASAMAGFYNRDSYLELATGERCGPLAGSPQIVALEGKRLFGEEAEAFAAAQARCASGQPVSLTTRSGTTILAPCTRPLRAPPIGYMLDAAPPLALAVRSAGS